MKVTAKKAVAAFLAALTLYLYQKRWLADRSRFKLAVKSRQIGWTFVVALEVTLERMEKPGLTLWLSASERQALEAMQHIQRFARGLRIAVEYEGAHIGVDTWKHQVAFKDAKGNVYSRIIALPANSDTVRGYAGDVVLDEFAFHRDADAIWRAAFAIVTRGYSLKLMSSPGGRRGKFYELAQACGAVDPTQPYKQAGQWRSGSWAAHWCNAWKAKEEGFDIDVEQLRAAIADDFAWRQEYECEFLDESESLIRPEWITDVEDPAIFAARYEPAGWQPVVQKIVEQLVPGEFNYLGGDIGRKQDQTLLWLGSAESGAASRPKTRAVISLVRWPFSDQRELLNALLPHLRRACLDASGLGLQLSEELQEAHGQKVEPVVFTPTVKEDLAMLNFRAFQERLLPVPAVPWVRYGILAVKRLMTSAGNIRYDATRDTVQGHGDAFWSCGLFLHAAAGPALSTDLVASGRGMAAQLGNEYGGSSSAYQASQGY